MQWLKIFVRPIPAYRQNPKLPSSAGSLHKGPAKADISEGRQFGVRNSRYSVDPMRGWTAIIAMANVTSDSF
jgi:hypothetical protein